MSNGNLSSSFHNLISGLGTNNDQGGNNDFCARARIDVGKIEGAMRVDPILRNIIEAAPLDAVRAWRVFDSADDGSIKDWKDAEDELDYRDAVETALVYAETYGGAVVVPSFDSSVVSTADYRNKFDINQIEGGVNSIRGFLVYACSELKRYDKNPSLFKPSDPRKGFPDRWEIIKDKNSTLFNLNKTIIHSSWMMPVKGPRSYRHNRPQLGSGYFGESRVDIVFDYLSRAVTGMMSGSTSLHKSTIDVYYGNFAEDLHACGSDPQKLQAFFCDVQARIQQTMLHTSSNHPVALDIKNEKMERLGTNNSSAAMEPLIRMYMELLCAARQMPLTRALGQKQAGLSSDNRSDLVNWYDLVASFRDKRMLSLIKWMDGLVAHDKGMGALRWNFGELMPLSVSDKADIDEKNAKRDEIYVNRVGLPKLRPHIMRNLSAAGTYAFTEDEIAEMENNPPEIDDAE